MEVGNNADVVYLDFATAFDKVNINLVIEKIKCLGIGGKIIEWITSFLKNRQQYVLVDGVLSHPSPVISGVPQGSVFGPLIFLVLIGDIDGNTISSSVRSFADDTRLIKAVSNEKDTECLQEDLLSIYHWATSNNMKFNDIKFELLRYGPNERIKQSTSYQSSNGEDIDEKQMVRDLGIVMSNDCIFKRHINEVIETAKKLTSWILRALSIHAQA